MDFTKYLVENAYVLIPVLYILGNILKDLKFIADKYIPLLLLVLGILLSCAWLGFDISAVIQGILLTGITVYSNQVIKQILKKETSIANISLEAINKANEVKEEIKTESTSTAINDTVPEKSQGIVITQQGIESTGKLIIKDEPINQSIQSNNLAASSKINVDTPKEEQSAINSQVIPQ